MKKLLLVTAALVAAVAVLSSVTLPPRRLAAPAASRRHGSRHPSRPHQPIRRPRAGPTRSPRRPRAPASSSSSSPITATRRASRIRRRTDPACSASTASRSARPAGTTSRSTCRHAPYPLGGEPRDVVEDVRRLGGFGIAAHPGFAQAAAALERLDGAVRRDRDREPRHQLAAWADRQAADRRAPSAMAGATAPARGAARLSVPAAGNDRPASLRTGRTWSQHGPRLRRAGGSSRSPAPTRTRRLGAARAIRPTTAYALPIPGYESSFRDAVGPRRARRAAVRRRRGRRARVLMRAIRAGHLYMAVDGVATPPSFEFTATNDRGTAQRRATARRRRAGDAARPQQRARRRSRPSSGTAPASRRRAPRAGLHGRGAGGAGASTGSRSRAPDRALRRGVADRATRSTCASAGRGERRPSTGRGREPARCSTAAPAPAGASSTIPTSLAAVEVAPIVGGAELRFRFGLSGGSPVGQVAALVADTPQRRRAVRSR